MKVLSGNVFSLATILEELASEAGIDRIFFALDPISLKIASQITLRRIRKKFIKSLEEFLKEWIKDPRKAVILLSPEREEIRKVLIQLEGFLPILLRNEANCVFIILAKERNVVKEILNFSFESSIEFIIPPDLSSLAKFLFGSVEAKKCSVIVCEPMLIEEGHIGFSYGLRTSEAIGVESSATEIGHGPVAILTLGAMFRFVANIIFEQEMLSDVKLIGFLKLGSFVRENLVSILRRHRYVIIADYTGTIIPIASSIAYNLVSQSEIEWVPEIVDLLGDLGSGEAMDPMGVTNMLRGFLGRGPKTQSENIIKMRNEIIFLLSGHTESFVDYMNSQTDFEVLCVKPFISNNSRIGRIRIHELMRLPLIDKNFIVVTHISYLIRFFDSFRPLIELKDGRSTVIVVDTTFVERSLLDKLLDILDNMLMSLKERISILNLKEDSFEEIANKLKKTGRVIVLA